MIVDSYLTMPGPPAVKVLRASCTDYTMEKYKSESIANRNAVLRHVGNAMEMTRFPDGNERLYLV